MQVGKFYQHALAQDFYIEVLSTAKADIDQTLVSCALHSAYYPVTFEITQFVLDLNQRGLWNSYEKDKECLK